MSIASANQLLTEVIQGNGSVTVLTGAGISAESGIPTFRGPEGFWIIGSKEYHPQEMATLAMFSRNPEAVWVWYLYRMDLCRKARPNAGHRALASMEFHLKNQFTLITQNVDNLHILAGNSLSRTLQIHGNIFQARCASACTDDIFPLPENLPPKAKGSMLTDSECRQLKCPICGSWLRPHVLWFDETYNERHYHFNTALETAKRTRLLITVGTAGATTLPNHIVNLVLSNGGLMFDINVTDNPFGGLAMQSRQGIFIKGTSSEALVALARTIASAQVNL
ncbi:Sir2 family NAD-dependent protein deacetylase [uncultured Desulfosarcina sp.]|uniref:SIR2 family NAD-dependent protein deacylase n=1 Tax=uncultured Desulfosarcina sp. TaxID=218289 RepID=UPI0029C9B140|nr:Sir2 family NAD-dependent protein deacetylase [uncultured Desulfosarcina sp.]